MRRKLVYLVLFLAGTMLYTTSGECKWYSRVRIDSAIVDYDNEIVYINGDNFGYDPEVFMDDVQLNVLSYGDTYIDAEFPDFEPGTYRLLVRTVDSRYHRWKSKSTMSMTIGAAGASGEKGAPGDPGPKGDKGAPGVVGPQGDKGDKGAPGAAGPQGDKGDKGAPGVAGPKGDKGDMGDPGVAGPKGDKGDKGDPGVAGPKGDKGDNGDPGVAGSKGDKGGKGDPGDPGISRYIQHRASRTEIGIQAGQTYNFEVKCPDKRLVLGGGGRVTMCSPSSTPCTVVLGDSYPAGANIWGVSFRNLGQDLRLINISAYAVCADVKN